MKTVVIAVILIAAVAVVETISVQNSYTEGKLEGCQSIYNALIRPFAGGECTMVNGEVCLVGPRGETICLDELKNMVR